MLPRFAVRRPVTVLMATLAVVTFGLLAATDLPVELLPDLSYPTLTVQTVYEDAAPTSVEQFVTRPIEEAVGVIPGVRDMRSTSRAGLSEVTLELEWGEGMDTAALEVRERLGLVELPREAEVPRVLRFDPSLEPVMRLALSGDRPLDDLRLLAERWIKPRLEAVGGVAAARIRGGLDPEVVVEVDEDRLAALGLGLPDLARALSSENVNQPGGALRDANAVYLVRTLNEFVDLDQIRRTVVRTSPSGQVRVEDVARVLRGHRDRDEISRLDGREVVEVDLHRQGLANTVTVAANVRAELERLAGEMPPDMKLVPVTDLSRYIAEAVSDVQQAAWLGGLLAIVVLYFFLRDLRATATIALSIPVSVVATFLAMQQTGVTFNVMSLGGLALGIGMLVDASIVVLEAIDRHRRAGRDRTEAAVSGAGEVAAAVTASTLTTVAVFLPIVFVQGVAGQLFRDQAVTVCLSLLTSLVVSLTLIPALSAFDLGRLLEGVGGSARRSDARPAATERLPLTLRLGPLELQPLGDGRGRASRLLTLLALPLRFPVLLLAAVLGGAWRLVDGVFGLAVRPLAAAVAALDRRYPGGLAWALRRRWAVLAVSFVLFALSVTAIPLLGTGLVPDLAQGEFAFQLRFPESSTLSATNEAVEGIERLLVEDPALERVFVIVGSLPAATSGRRTLGENLAQLDFRLRDGSTAEEETAVLDRVRQVLARFPRADAELVRPAVLAMRPPVAVEIFSDDLDELDRIAGQVKAALDRLPVLRDVASSAEPGHPEILVEVDRDRAATLGVSAEAVGIALRSKIRGDVVGQLREGEERIDIRLRASERFRDLAADVDALRILLADGTALPVSAVARVEATRGPATISRSGGARMAEVTAQAAITDLGNTLSAVASALQRLAVPAGVRLELAGQSEELQLSFRSLWLALGLATFLVYVVMACQFESLLHPLVILAAVPLGVVGVVAALLLTGRGVDVLVLIGSVMLAGIVVNNAIVLVDAVNRRRREGSGLDEALVEAGRERLRPIQMTTLTTVLGLLPMALGLGAGGELRSPLAITVIGGLTVSTVLTLVVTPCLYRVVSGPGHGSLAVPAPDPGPDSAPGHPEEARRVDEGSPTSGLTARRA